MLVIDDRDGQYHMVESAREPLDDGDGEIYAAPPYPGVWPPTMRVRGSILLTPETAVRIHRCNDGTLGPHTTGREAKGEHE